MTPKAAQPLLPSPRGPISEALITALESAPDGMFRVPSTPSHDPLADEDLQLALYVAYELHYRGFGGIDERWEWNPALLAARAALEDEFEQALVALAGEPQRAAISTSEVDRALRAIVDDEHGPSVARYIEHRASIEQVHEFLIHRSAYQLKEADPHSWALPRLTGRPKAALVEVQADEYGGGRAERIHAQLFADTLLSAGLDPGYGAYLDQIPAITLATVNLMSMFGLHRRWRGAIVGHLAAFEMTSSIPNRRYASGLRRLGFDSTATRFFDEHVVADAVHENIAAVDLAGGLVTQEPSLAGDVLWGARTLMLLDARWSAHVIEAWTSGRSSLHTSATTAADHREPRVVA